MQLYMVDYMTVTHYTSRLSAQKNKILQGKIKIELYIVMTEFYASILSLDR